MKLNNKYFILRHGQTIYQTRKSDMIYPDIMHDNVSLTLKGRKEVERSVKKIKKEKIDLIYSSDFKRTKQTAQIAAKNLNIKEINFDERLREINLGVYYNKTRQEFYIEFPKFSDKLLRKKPEKGESWVDCKKRLKSFLKDIDGKYKNKKILIVSHGDPLWLLQGIVQKININDLILNKRKIFPKTGEIKKLN